MQWVWPPYRQVAAGLAHSGLEPEFINVDIWQSRLPALRAEMLAPLANPSPDVL